jgi:hypothetical protein
MSYFLQAKEHDMNMHAKFQDLILVHIFVINFFKISILGNFL